MSAGPSVAGVDGCRGGWLVALRSLASPSDLELLLVSTFADVLALSTATTVIAVDMPIGLPDRIGPGGRGADRAARANLGGRQSSVFAIPSRSAIMQESYADACAAAFATSDPPRKISKQAFNIFPKIREVDRLMTPALQARVVECHPELAFWSLNGRVALAEPKKVKSQAHVPGLEERRRLLATAGYPARKLAASPFRNAVAGADDVLDACALSWAAVNIHHGTALRFPATPERDSKNLRVEIWAG
jgi:predicted RNase H-like nuclease